MRDISHLDGFIVSPAQLMAAAAAVRARFVEMRRLTVQALRLDALDPDEARHHARALVAVHRAAAAMKDAAERGM